MANSPDHPPYAPPRRLHASAHTAGRWGGFVEPLPHGEGFSLAEMRRLIALGRQRGWLRDGEPVLPVVRRRS